MAKGTSVARHLDPLQLTALDFEVCERFGAGDTRILYPYFSTHEPQRVQQAGACGIDAYIAQREHSIRRQTAGHNKECRG